MENKIVLKEQQQEALTKLLSFIEDDSLFTFNFSGYSGTGKSTSKPTSSRIRIKTFPTEEEEACLALSQLCQWRDKYNEGWKPDYTDDSSKYTILYINNKVNTTYTHYQQYLLTFKTEIIRNKFLENFKELIEIAKTLS